jgi:ribosomal protein L13
MLPKNKLRKNMMLRLKLVAGTEHNFWAQKPETIHL